jgi:hypothetical protein
VVIRMLGNVQQVTIKPLIQATIVSGALVYTDEYDIYTQNRHLLGVSSNLRPLYTDVRV